MFKVNPPLREKADVEAVRLGLADGTLDAIATDHAPHAREDKEVEWATAPPGMLGLETALGDFEQPDTLDAAMAGCDHLFLLSPPSPHQPEQERNAIDAAKRAGVGHVVALSVLGSSPDASVAFGRWHGEIDRHLYREEYLQAVDFGHDLGLRLDVRSVASAARLAPADATT